MQTTSGDELTNNRVIIKKHPKNRVSRPSVDKETSKPQA
jgi:hypothetical protein